MYELWFLRLWFLTTIHSGSVDSSFLRSGFGTFPISVGSSQS
jgi:hypothetical protein